MSLLRTEWPTSPLGRLAYINQRALAETTEPEYTFRYIDIASVGRGELVEEPTTLRFEDAPSRARRIICKGDTIVSTVRTYLRAVLPIRDDAGDLIASTGFAVLSPGDGIDNRFLSWYAQSDPFIEEIVARSVGVSYPAIAPSELARFPVPTPKLADQRAIADYLDAETARIDALIEKKRRLASALEERQALLVRRELDSAEQVLPLRRVVSHIQTGTTPTGRILEQPQESDTEWFTPADLGPGLLVQSSERRLDEKALQERAVPRLPADSVLIVGIGATAGKVGYLDREGSSNQQITCLVPNEMIQARLLAWQLSTRIDELRSTAPYTTLPILNNDFLLSFPVKVPPSHLSREILGRLDEADANATVIKSRLEKQIELLTEHRQALITAAVTGQVEVAGAALSRDSGR